MRRTLLIAALALTALAVSAIPATTHRIASETIDPACAEWNALPASVKKIVPPPPNCSIGEDVEPIGSSLL
ncbi:hypothetical protein ABI59_14745 [Acidobacteria bacterium Mor1]|nr:hypothetical protein ABI59_14745 [Acidobacteria bacterium Mor1]